MNRKRKTAIILYMLLFTTGWSQGVTYSLTPETIRDKTLKAKIETNISRLLSAINDAYNSGSNSINYSGIDIHDSASLNIGRMWNLFHFKTERKLYTGNLIQIGEEKIYHQGNIGVILTPVDGTNYSGDRRREMSVYLDAKGKIIDFDYSIGLHDYENVMKSGERLGDLEKYQQIVQWCNYLQEAYCTKNIQFIDDVFSQDALIIVGQERTKREERNDRVVLKKEYTYKEYSKKEYIDNLKKRFHKNGYVNVKFDDFEITPHRINPNFFGVTLKQTWRSTTYSDEGILFLIWDFTDEDKPQIHVRVWQHIDQERFSMGDFDIPDK